MSLKLNEGLKKSNEEKKYDGSLLYNICLGLPIMNNEIIENCKNIFQEN